MAGFGRVLVIGYCWGVVVVCVWLAGVGCVGLMVSVALGVPSVVSLVVGAAGIVDPCDGRFRGSGLAPRPDHVRAVERRNSAY